MARFDYAAYSMESKTKADVAAVVVVVAALTVAEPAPA